MTNSVDPPLNAEEESKGVSIAVNLLGWTMVNVVLPLLPLAIVWILFHLKNQPVDWSKSTDLLFLIVVLTVTSLSDIVNTKKDMQKDLLWSMMFWVTLLGLLVSAVFYGVLLYTVNDSQIDKSDVSLRQGLHQGGIWLAIVYIPASALCRFFVAKVQGRA